MHLQYAAVSNLLVTEAGNDVSVRFTFDNILEIPSSMCVHLWEVSCQGLSGCLVLDFQDF